MQGVVRAGARLAGRTSPRQLLARTLAAAGPRALVASTTPRRLYTSSNDGKKSSIYAAFLNLLASASSRREVDQYLGQFRAVSPHQFAVVKVGGAILTDHLVELCFALQQLHAIGLYPIIVHGAGPQMNQTLLDSGVEPDFIDGIRVTDKKTLGIARRLFLEANMDLVMTLKRDWGVPARPITAGALQADYLDKDKWKYVGNITKINPRAIMDALENKELPILCSMAETEDGQILNVNADVVAAALAREFEPLKVIYLSEKGGLFNAETGKLISHINLEGEYDSYMKQPWVRYGTKLKIVEAKKLLDGLPKTSSVAITHPQNLGKELFTHTGGGTLIRNGGSVKEITKFEDLDLKAIQEALSRDRGGAEAGNAVSQYLENLKSRPFEVFHDDSMGVVAVVYPPGKDGEFAQLSTFTTTHDAFLTNVADLVFEQIKQKYSKLYWVVESQEQNLVKWHLEKTDGFLRRDQEIFCWWGSAQSSEIFSLLEGYSKQGRGILKDSLDAQFRRAADFVASLKQGQQVRNYSTAASPRTLGQSSRPTLRQSTATSTSSRGFATTASRSLETTNPNPPYGIKFKSKDWPSKIALIGARGYTGQALIELLNKHPNMDLRHVSSRELNGKKLEGYTKRNIIYENLSPEDVKRMADKGEVDCWVMALPNGVCKPFVDAINEAGKSDAVIVDLSADYRFDDSWTYGLPETVDRRKLADAKRIANPGCYATAAQLGIAPLLEFIGGQPTVFGVSGYSGAGTKPSPKNDVEYLTNNIIPYSLVDHVHEKEITRQLGTEVAFIPHVAVWFQGIHHTISIPLNRTMTSRDIRNLYQDRYAGEKLVKVVGESPLVKNIAGKHGVEIGGFAVHSSGKRVVVNATIDNLLKGAATQCLQNMNLALGYGEYEGIPY
ncbi:bifunctional acetylglutamate kinase/N-acetyl-gamma-glutamyl-phosphate reductase [Dothidotthia symphoricarpi CBS 119687]|uniref:acetylglutamate kinase n=1 Tax=Dothidotthia symphoricarpi CBS 119687 TaxID=1392245 RepID=A0A6A6AJH4_9PLEO|nr:bifunctional acetylglutamate kinase/N-acetyl-gamma-glutamyl-phosphate reductase [Dothidotthia symphoricarpi CBS 119687]KAF2131064.1 bifunctional acetylglutamate kinase/N-acetyl-gamma-glutamyl-phosphate reductase [Dothidotthia symphoricarpi CBS 119687]